MVMEETRLPPLNVAKVSDTTYRHVSVVIPSTEIP